MNMKIEIEQTLLRPVCGGWDRGFLESVLEQVVKGRTLSVKQKNTLTKVLERNDESSQVVHDNWSTEYEKSHKAHAHASAGRPKSPMMPPPPNVSVGVQLKKPVTPGLVARQTGPGQKQPIAPGMQDTKKPVPPGPLPQKRKAEQTAGGTQKVARSSWPIQPGPVTLRSFQF